MLSLINQAAKMRKTNFFKKIILTIIISLSLLAFLIKPVAAFETPSLSYPFQFEEAISGTDEMNLQSFVNETLKAVAGSILRFISGSFIDLNSEGWLSQNSLNWENQGLLATSGLIIGGFYLTPPASGIQYLADIGRNLKLVKPALAQEQEGVGFHLMKIVMPMWRSFRNVTYLLFVLVLIGMGFAIMFRIKISPQAVITLQSALPRIIIGLLLITFSYAIVGLLLDLTILLSSFIAGMFNQIFTQNFSIFPEKPILVAKNIVETLTPYAFEKMVVPLVTAAGYTAVAGPVFILGLLLIPGVGVILTLILAILILIAIFRALWTLLKAFAMITVNLIFAPFRILIGVFPGNNAIGDWFKDLLANLAVYPVMLTMLLTGDYLILSGAKGLSTATIAGGTLGSEGLGFLTITGITIFYMFVSFILPLAGIMIIFLIPKASEIIQSFITKKPFAYGTAIGQAFGPAVFMTKGVSRYGAEMGIQHLEGRADVAGRKTGADVGLARVLRQVLGHKK
jgi:hypothetical protein